MSNLLSFQEAKEQCKSMKFRTITEYTKWVQDNNFEELFPVNPATAYKEYKGGADFLGWTQEQYKKNIFQCRAEKVDFKAIGQKVSATHARRKQIRQQAETVAPKPVKEESNLISAEEMVKFFIREDVDMKVIVTFLSEFSHPKDVYQIFLDYLKSKYTVKI